MDNGDATLVFISCDRTVIYQAKISANDSILSKEDEDGAELVATSQPVN